MAQHANFTSPQNTENGEAELSEKQQKERLAKFGELLRQFEEKLSCEADEPDSEATSQQDHESENPEQVMAASVKPLMAEEENPMTMGPQSLGRKNPQPILVW